MINTFIYIVILNLLFYSKINNTILLCVDILLIFASLFYRYEHKHFSFSQLNKIALDSYYNKIKPSLKLYFVIISVFIIISSKSYLLSIIVLICASWINIYSSKLSFGEYIGLIRIVLGFILLSILAIIINYSRTEIENILSIKLFKGYIYISEVNRRQGIVLLLKSLSSISMFYFLTLSTTTDEIIAALKAARLPSIFTDLIYLIYRYIFILIDIYQNMYIASKARLGFKSFKSGIYTRGRIYTNLFYLSYRKAVQSFNAMESRFFIEDIRFLERKRGNKYLIHFLLLIIIEILISRV